MEFKSFYEEFKKRASQQDLDYLKHVISKDLLAREIRDGEAVDYDYEDSIEGWKQAFDHFSGMDMEWIYTDHTMTQLKENEWQASFWVSLIIEGKLLETSNLFFNTYQKEDESWKLVRTYIESGVKNPEIVAKSSY